MSTSNAAVTPSISQATASFTDERVSSLISISSLDPESPIPRDRCIKAEVSLLWPYSSSTSTIALLLADPDFRLRQARGQIRAVFHGAAAKALATAHVGIGDAVNLHLSGARWSDPDSSAVRLTPGRAVDGELVFDGGLDMTFGPERRRLMVAGERRMRSVVEGQLPRTPARARRSTQGGYATETPASSGSVYSGSAHLKKLRLSQEMYVESPGLIRQDSTDDFWTSQSAKRRKVAYKGVVEWKFAKGGVGRDLRQAEVAGDTENLQDPDVAMLEPISSSALTQALDNRPAASDSPQEPSQSQISGAYTTSTPASANSQAASQTHDAVEDLSTAGEEDEHVLEAQQPAITAGNASPSLALDPPRSSFATANRTRSTNMAPPPLPPLAMPDMDLAANSRPQEDPTTPRLHAALDASLPLPSPFPQTPLTHPSNVMEQNIGEASSLRHTGQAHDHLPAVRDYFSPGRRNVQPKQLDEPLIDDHESEMQSEEPPGTEPKQPQVVSPAPPQILDDLSEARDNDTQEVRSVSQLRLESGHIKEQIAADTEMDVLASPDSGSEADISSEDEEANVDDEREAHDKISADLSQKVTAPGIANAPSAPGGEVLGDDQDQHSRQSSIAESESLEEGMSDSQNRSDDEVDEDGFEHEGAGGDDEMMHVQAPVSFETAVLESDSDLDGDADGTNVPAAQAASFDVRRPSAPSQLPKLNDHRPFGDVQTRLVNEKSTATSKFVGQEPENDNTSQDEDAAWEAMDDAMIEMADTSHEKAQAPALALTSVVGPRPLPPPIATATSIDHLTAPATAEILSGTAATTRGGVLARPLEVMSDDRLDANSSRATSGEVQTLAEAVDHEMNEMADPITEADEVLVENDFSDPVPIVSRQASIPADTTSMNQPDSPTTAVEDTQLAPGSSVSGGAYQSRDAVTSIETGNGTESPIEPVFDMKDVTALSEVNPQPDGAKAEASPQEEVKVEEAKPANAKKGVWTKLRARLRAAREKQVVATSQILHDQQLGSIEVVDLSAVDDDVGYPVQSIEPKSPLNANELQIPLTEPEPYSQLPEPELTVPHLSGRQISVADSLASPITDLAPESLSPYSRASTVADAPLEAHPQLYEDEDGFCGMMASQELDSTTYRGHVALQKKPDLDTVREESPVVIRRRSVSVMSERSSDVLDLPTEAARPRDYRLLVEKVHNHQEASPAQVPLNTGTRLAGSRQSKSRLNLLPGSLGMWFTPSDSRHSPDKQEVIDRRTTIGALPTAQASHVPPSSAPTNPTVAFTTKPRQQRQRSISPPPLKRFSQSSGTTTTLTYLVPLTNLSLSLNTSQSAKIDVLAIATSASSDAVRAKTGPRDWYTVLHILDPALWEQLSNTNDPPTHLLANVSSKQNKAPDTERGVRVEVFRPWKASLPQAAPGEAVLLRNFTVRSRGRAAYLLSGEESAWCVFRRGEGGWRTARVSEEVRGPPIEVGDGERERARELGGWWDVLSLSSGPGNWTARGKGKGKARLTM